MNAILTSDYKAVLAVTLVVGLIYSIVNILVDVVHACEIGDDKRRKDRDQAHHKNNAKSQNRRNALGEAGRIALELGAD